MKVEKGNICLYVFEEEIRKRIRQGNEEKQNKMEIQNEENGNHWEKIG